MSQSYSHDEDEPRVRRKARRGLRVVRWPVRGLWNRPVWFCRVRWPGTGQRVTELGLGIVSFQWWGKR